MSALQVEGGGRAPAVGDAVRHPRYGAGRLVEVYRGGTEWLVRFETGLRFRRPSDEFGPEARAGLPRPALARYEPPPPMPRSRFEARGLIEALRVGVAPERHLRELTIGLADERASLAAALNRAHRQGGDVRAVIGEYGFGKSHFLQLAAEEALARDFLVASTSLDLLELPAHRPFDLYAALTRSLRYPNDPERGLGPLLDAAAAAPSVVADLHARAPVAGDPLVVALEALASGPPRRLRAEWHAWLMGGRKVPALRKALPRGSRVPSIYTSGHNARQIAYLLSGLSAVARLANYSGLVVLVDEAESYALLRARDRLKAGTFFSALVAAALGPGQDRVDEASLAEHRYGAYPVGYGAGQSLFFLFTLTHTDERMPLESWLAPSQIVILDPHHTVKEIGRFLGQVQGYHAQAYGYEPDERHGQVRRAATEHLAAGMRADRLSIRGVVRLSVELFDLLFLYPDYDAATLLDELQRQVR